MNAYHTLKTTLAWVVAVSALSGCGPRVIIATGTTIGLKATPGDGNTRPPQVTFGYKRAELALVPTKTELAVPDKSDAFSTLAAIHFTSLFFGKTEIRSVVGTGFAARDIQESAEQKKSVGGEPGVADVPDAGTTGPTDFWTAFTTTVGGDKDPVSRGQDPQ